MGVFRRKNLARQPSQPVPDSGSPSEKNAARQPPQLRPDVDKLREMGDVTGLICALRHSDPGVRGHAAWSLGKVAGHRPGSPGGTDTASAVEPLIAVLHDESREVRWKTVFALGKFGRLGDDRVVQPLIAALGDEDSGVRHTAAMEILGLAPATLRDAGDIAVGPLITALADDDHRVRADAALALGRCGDARAVEPLIAALGDEDRQVRAGAAGALGRLGDPRAVEPLIATLPDRPSVLDHGPAAGALAQLGDPRAIAPLAAAFHGSAATPRNAESFVEALVSFGDRGLEALIQNAQGNGKLREIVGKLLEDRGDPRALEVLVPAEGDRERLTSLRARYEALDLAESSVDDMTSMLNSELDWMRANDHRLDEVQYEFRIRKISVAKIGAELYRRGGEELMRKVHSLVPSASQRNLELQWSGIGGWMA